MLEILKRIMRNDNEEPNNEDEESPSYLTLFVAELFGTAMLMFLGCMGCITGMVNMAVVPHWPGLNFGLTVMAVIQTIGHISGAHLNPQVSLGAVIIGKMKLKVFPIYCLAQIIGGFLGTSLLRILTPTNFQSDMCLTKLHSDLNIYQGLFIEVTITALLLVICGAVWDRRNLKNGDSLPLRFGLFIGLVSMNAGPYTGASMNSVRSLAPAVLSNYWENHWVYWVGPTLGAIIGSSFYRIFFNPKSESLIS